MSSSETNPNFSGFSFVNSTLAPTCFLFICIIVMIVFSTTTPIPPVVWGTQASMTFLSMCVTFIIWFLVKRNTQDFLVDQRRNDNTMNIKLIFFWTFGLINMFNSALNMGANIDCLLTDGREPFRFSHVLSIFVHLTEILFCVSQLGFLSFYGKFCFKPSPLINYGVSFMIIAHLLRWFRRLFDSILSCSCLNWETLNTTLQEDCFYSSDINAVRTTLDPYINPVIIEYSLLSTALVVRMFVNVFTNNLIRSQIDQEETQEITNNEDLSVSEMFTRRTSTFSSLTCGVVLSVPLLVMCIYSFSNQNNSENIYRIISTAYEMAVYGILVFGKWKFKSQFQEISSKETMSCGYQTILIFVTSGTVAYKTFGGIAGLMTAKEPYGLLLFMNEILQTIVIITQTSFILHMKSIMYRPRPIRHVKYIRVNQVFLCIFTMNILRWLVESVVMGLPSDATSRQLQFYGPIYWRTIEHTIFPVDVFYRFLTAIEMYEQYRITNRHLHSLHN